MMFGKPLQRVGGWGGSERLLMHLLKSRRSVFDTEHLHPISLLFARLCTLTCTGNNRARRCKHRPRQPPPPLHPSPSESMSPSSILLQPLSFFYISFLSCPSNTPLSSRLIFLVFMMYIIITTLGARLRYLMTSRPGLLTRLAEPLPTERDRKSARIN